MVYLLAYILVFIYYYSIISILNYLYLFIYSILHFKFSFKF